MNTVVASQLKLTVTFQDHDVDHNHINDDHVHDDDQWPLTMQIFNIVWTKTEMVELMEHFPQQDLDNIASTQN